MPTKIVRIDDVGWYKDPCTHPNHEPPTHIVIPNGHKLVHTCPRCGEVTEIVRDYRCRMSNGV